MAERDKPLKRKAAASAPDPAPRVPDDAFGFAGILAVADMLPVMVAYVDKDLRYRFMNKPMADWFERPRAELLGLHMRELLGPEVWEHREPLVAAAMAGERKFFATDFPHPTRGNLAVQTNYMPWADGSGEVFGLIILVQDVTEQRAAERALRESEERFRRIANQAPVLMWVTRLDRTRDFVNEAYVEFVGGDRELARTMDWRERIHPDDQARIVAESIAGEATRETFTLEGRYRNGAGEYRWLKSTSSPRFGPDGELAGFIGAATDITVA
jgi:PAS domain S-box-containing protein